MPGNAGWVLDLAFSPDGQTLLWVGTDGVLVQWDVKFARPKGSPESIGPLRSVTLSPDARLLAIGDETGTIRLREVEDRYAPKGNSTYGHVSTVVVSPDGGLVAVGGDQLVLLNIAAQQVADLNAYDVLDLAFDGKGGVLASAHESGTVRLWDVAARKELGQPIQARSGYVRGVALTPDGKKVVAVSDDGVDIWDVATREPAGKLAPGKQISVMTLSPDGKTLALSGDEKVVRVWDMDTREPVGAPLVGHENTVSSLAFSADGGRLASGDQAGNIRLWDIKRLQLLPPLLFKLNEWVSSLAFSPDGAMLAATGMNREFRLFDLASRQVLGGPLFARAEYKVVTSVAFDPTGTLLVAGEQDGGLSFFSVGLEAWSARACELANRNLSRDEWCRFMRDEPYRATCPKLPAPDMGVTCP